MTISVGREYSRADRPAGNRPPDQRHDEEQPYLFHAWPPTTMAGPRLRAGFTETPVTWMKTIWTITSVRPMIRPDGCRAADCDSCVTPRIVAVKMNVPMISARIAETIPYSPR